MKITNQYSNHKALKFLFMCIFCWLFVSGISQNIVNINTQPSCAFSPTGSIQLSIDANLLEPSYILPFETQILNTSTGEIIIEFISSWNTTFEQLAAGLYEIAIDLTDECDLLLWNIEITEIPTTDINAIAKVIPAPCGVGVGSIHILSTSNGTPPYSYLWNTGATSAQLLDIPPGTYCVTITDAECGYRELCRTVGQAIPWIDVVNFKHIGQCENGSALLNCDGFVDIEVSGMTGGTPSYLWSGPNGFSSSQQDINGLCTAGTYNVTVTFSDQCAPLIQQINLCCCSDFNVNGQPNQQCQPQYSSLSVTSTVIPSISGLNNGMIFLELTGGSGNYLCTWTRNNTPYRVGPSRIFNLSPGQYCVSINDGCSYESFYECFNVIELSCDHIYTNEELIGMFVNEVVPACLGGGSGSITLTTPHSSWFTPPVVHATYNNLPVLFSTTAYYMHAVIPNLGEGTFVDIRLSLGTCTYEFSVDMPSIPPVEYLTYVDINNVECDYQVFCHGTYVATVTENGWIDISNGRGGFFPGQCRAPVYCRNDLVGEYQFEPITVSGLEYWIILQSMGQYIPHYGVLQDWFILHDVRYCDRVTYCPADFSIVFVEQGLREIYIDWEGQNEFISSGDGCVRAKCPWPISHVEVCLDDLDIPDEINQQFAPDLTGCGQIGIAYFRQIELWSSIGAFMNHYHGSSLEAFITANSSREKRIAQLSRTAEIHMNFCLAILNQFRVTSLSLYLIIATSRTPFRARYPCVLVMTYLA